MFLKNLWYYAMPAAQLKPGRMIHKVLLGEPVLIGRTGDGIPFAIRDLCPHRGVPLSSGRMLKPGTQIDGAQVKATQIECPYHGWRFDTAGTCAAIPSLVPGQDMDVNRIKVRRYPLKEVQGSLWIHMGGHGEGPVLEETPEPEEAPPHMPGIGERRPGLIETAVFDCHVDHAVIGLMDPAHGPYVHQAWWWRSPKSIHAKAKKFAPVERGFSMLAHKPSKNSLFYRFLGGGVTTEITFRLPGIRTELIEVGSRGTVLGLTAVTPVTETQTEVTQSFYWTLPWLTPIKEFLRPLVRTFLHQDRDMVNLQRQGLKFDPRLMLINDADMQAKWYFRLKKAWTDSGEGKEPFDHPFSGETTLHWRS